MESTTTGKAPGSRLLTYITAALFVLIGAILFFAPHWAAANFAWEISPFVAMTMGGWYLGSAAMAYEAARIWRWPAIHGTLIFTWAFGLTEGLLLIIHRDVLRFDTALGIPYTLILAVASLNGLLGIAGYLRERPARQAEGLPSPWWARVMFVGFVLYVSLLVVLLADGIAPDGKIWPGPLSLLTARAFGAFFGSLVLGGLPLIFARGMAPIESFVRPGLVLSAIIEIAALFFLGQFDFVNKPGGLIYHISYGASIVAALILVVYGYLARRRPRTSMPLSAGGAS